jgi:acetyl-CoA C-acetyltransferase
VTVAKQRTAVLGVGQTKYQSTRGDVSMAGLVREAALRALADAGMEWADVDAVVIATRHDSHARYVVQALERGKHVFVEKPLCLSRDELRAIETAAEA